MSGNFHSFLFVSYTGAVAQLEFDIGSATSFGAVGIHFVPSPAVGSKFFSAKSNKVPIDNIHSEHWVAAPMIASALVLG